MIENLKYIIESLLFVADETLTVEKIRRIFPDVEPGEIRAALTELVEEHRERQGGFFLSEVAGGYQFRTHPDFNTYIRRMVRPNAPRLSKAALETLAVIAYKQPVIRSDVEHIRGVDCGGVLRLLLERKLIRILGRKEIPGRPLIYATTKLFLEVFDLKDLKDLPTPKEIEEMSRNEMETLLPFSDGEDPATGDTPSPKALPGAENRTGDGTGPAGPRPGTESPAGAKTDPAPSQNTEDEPPVPSSSPGIETAAPPRESPMDTGNEPAEDDGKKA